ncbi:hypothetical protein FGX01_00680, partial [Xylella fastidiosa subsp. multiplex]|nr:hypothetical protein [Xylella fastidiosa subsp. multiplex]
PVARRAFFLPAQLQPGQRHRLPMPGRRAWLGGAVAASVAYLAVSPPLGLWSPVTDWNADYSTATGEQREVHVAGGVV